MAAAFIPSPEQIDAVIEWRALQGIEQVRRPIIPLLRERFGVSNAEAISIVRNAGHDDADNLKERFITAITGQGGAHASQ